MISTNFQYKCEHIKFSKYKISITFKNTYKYENSFILQLYNRDYLIYDNWEVIINFKDMLNNNRKWSIFNNTNEIINFIIDKFQSEKVIIKNNDNNNLTLTFALKL